MSKINILDSITINKIAAGEVVEKPMAVVKELVENSIDAGSSSITVEIKNGGLDMIRVTDNGSGIKSSDISTAFLRHATSKISDISDLDSLQSLGFRGEALASIAAVSMVECISKTSDCITGIRYVINGGKEEELKEIGCPEGTTFVVRNIFFNTPARLKFLKSPVTEGTYINDIVEKIALSHPEISFRFINNGKLKLQTSGNGKLKDVIYQIYGRDITNNIVPIEFDHELFSVTGFIGKPVISRGNKSYMIYFVNGRFVKSPVLYKAAEDAYDGFLMGHKYPFCIINISIDSSKIDVNVHPSKQEIRFGSSDSVYSSLKNEIRKTINNIDIIPTHNFDNKAAVNQRPVQKVKAAHSPEPFEKKRIDNINKSLETLKIIKELDYDENITVHLTPAPKQQTLFENRFDYEDKTKDYKIIGCVFNTYWIVEYNNEMYIMDQHAAHEKVLYEKFIKKLNENSLTVQPLCPPVIITLNPVEALLVNEHNDDLLKAGFEISNFGDGEYTVNSVPATLPNVNTSEVITDIISSISSENSKSKTASDTILNRIAMMSCKAAVKGGRVITSTEAKKLIDDLFKLDNPFNCPHGRPTIIKMTKKELEKKFGRQL